MGGKDKNVNQPGGERAREIHPARAIKPNRANDHDRFFDLGGGGVLAAA